MLNLKIYIFRFRFYYFIQRLLYRLKMGKNSNLCPPETFLIFAFSNWVRAARASCWFRWQTSFVAMKTRRHRNVTVVCTFARSYIFEYIMPVSEFIWFREKSKIIVNIYCNCLRRYCNCYNIYVIRHNTC